MQTVRQQIPRWPHQCKFPPKTRAPVAISAACGRNEAAASWFARAGRHARTGGEQAVSGDFRDL